MIRDKWQNSYVSTDIDTVSAFLLIVWALVRMISYCQCGSQAELQLIVINMSIFSLVLGLDIAHSDSALGLK